MVVQCDLAELRVENRMLKKMLEMKDEEIARLREEKDHLIDYLTVNYIITPKTIKVNMSANEEKHMSGKKVDGEEVL